jgi:4'-phosphopantetheinyl transferase
MKIYWSFQEAFKGRTEVDFSELVRFLGEEEKVYFDQLRFVKRRYEWMAGRMAMKDLILSVEPSLAYSGKQAVQILKSSSGAPFIRVSGLSKPIGAISLSHSNNYVLCGFSRESSQLGMDLELIEERPIEFIQDFFTTEEVHSINMISPEYTALVSTLIWSAKEAILKALSIGLKVDTRAIEVKLHQSDLVMSEWAPLKFSMDINNENSLRLFWLREEKFVLTACIQEGSDENIIRV